MPNHTATKLEVRGTSKEIADVIQYVGNPEGGEDENLFSCDKIIPMPKELRWISSPVKIVSKEEYEKKILERVGKKEGHDFGLPLTKELQEKYLNDYGADNWYDWANAKWGTKWGVYEVGQWQVLKEKKCTVATITFLSAWSPIIPIIPVMDVLAEKFPNLEFSLKYSDEGGGFLGVKHWVDGHNSGGSDLAWDSCAGVMLRKELGVYYPKDKEKKTIKPGEEKTYNCPICNELFLTKKDLATHKKYECSKKQCSNCGGKMPCKKLECVFKGMVVKTKTTKKKEYPCVICGKKSKYTEVCSFGCYTAIHKKKKIQSH